MWDCIRLGVGTPDGFILVVVELVVFREQVQELDCYFCIVVGERAEVPVLAVAFLEKTLAVLALISAWVIELLDFIVGIPALCICTVNFSALHVRIYHLFGIASTVPFPVIEPTAGVLVVGVVCLVAWLSFKCTQVEAKELASQQVRQISSMNAEANGAIGAGIEGTVGRLVAKRVVV